MNWPHQRQLDIKVNQEGRTAQDRPILERPILDEDGFQRLLAAAYILQPHTQHLAAQPVAAAPNAQFRRRENYSKANPFSAHPEFHHHLHLGQSASQSFGKHPKH